MGTPTVSRTRTRPPRPQTQTLLSPASPALLELLPLPPPPSASSHARLSSCPPVRLSAHVRTAPHHRPCTDPATGRGRARLPVGAATGLGRRLRRIGSQTNLEISRHIIQRLRVPLRPAPFGFTSQTPPTPNHYLPGLCYRPSRPPSRGTTFRPPLQRPSASPCRSRSAAAIRTTRCSSTLGTCTSTRSNSGSSSPRRCTRVAAPPSPSFPSTAPAKTHHGQIGPTATSRPRSDRDVLRLGHTCLLVRAAHGACFIFPHMPPSSPQASSSPQNIIIVDAGSLY